MTVKDRLGFDLPEVYMQDVAASLERHAVWIEACTAATTSSSAVTCLTWVMSLYSQLYGVTSFARILRSKASLPHWLAVY